MSEQLHPSAGRILATHASDRHRAEIPLACLMLFGAANAFGGGIYGLAGAEGVDPAWLDGTPFSDYTIPSLILMVVVGGSLVAASALLFARERHRKAAALSATVILLGWISVQVAMLGYVSWMQPATAVAGLLMLALAVSLPGQPGLFRSRYAQ